MREGDLFGATGPAAAVARYDEARRVLRMGWILPDARRALRVMARGGRPVDDLGERMPGIFGPDTYLAHCPGSRRNAALKYLEEAGCFDGHRLTPEGRALAEEIIADDRA